MTKTAFIAVDIQNDFCEGGSLAVTGGARVAQGVRDHLNQHHYPVVIATRDNHIDPGEHFAGDEGPNFSTSWPRHCEAGTEGAAFHPNLGEDFANEVTIFSKGEYEAAYSGFEGHGPKGEKLADALRGQGIERVVITGLATDHCVQATALDALKEGFGVTILTSLVAGVDPDRSRQALEKMQSEGATLV